jgi:hypothetical protein
MIKPALHAVERHGAGWHQTKRASLSLCRGGLEEKHAGRKGQNQQQVLEDDG